MSERYCPECKQTVEATNDDAWCPDCHHAFRVSVDKAELESLVGSLVVAATSLKRRTPIHWPDEHPYKVEFRDLEITAANFRKKYLEAK